MWNNVVKNAKILNDENIIFLAANSLECSHNELVLATYHAHENKTRLLIVPSQTSCLTSYFNGVNSLNSIHLNPLLENSLRNEDYYKWIAYKLLSFTHFSLPDMLYICKKANILNPELTKHLRSGVEKCTSCQTSVEPFNSRKISFDKLWRTFNGHAQVDLFYIKELTEKPIQHIFDKATGYFETGICPTTQIKFVCSVFNKIWLIKPGHPKAVSGDPEFLLSSLKNSINFEERPARKHNKVGIVKEELLALRLSRDATFNSFVKAFNLRKD